MYLKPRLVSRIVSAPMSVIQDVCFRRSQRPPPICSAMATSPISKNVRAQIVYCFSMTRRRITAGGGAAWQPAEIGRRWRLVIKDRARNGGANERPKQEKQQNMTTDIYT